MPSTLLEYIAVNPAEPITPANSRLPQDVATHAINFNLDNLTTILIIIVIAVLLVVIIVVSIVRKEYTTYIKNHIVGKIINSITYTIILFLLYNNLFWFKIEDPIVKGIISAILSLLLAVAYKIHLEELSSRIYENIKKDLYPAKTLLDKISNLNKFLNLLLRKKVLRRKDQVIILDQVFDDMSKLFSEKKQLIRYDAYMELLSSFAKEYDVIYGLNKTLPIYWIAPLEKKQESTLTYENVLLTERRRGLKVNRVTAISDIKVLRNQFGYACEMMKVKHESNYKVAWWFLNLLQNLYESGVRVACIVLYVSKLFDSYSEIACDTIIKGRDIDLELMYGIRSEDKERIVASVVSFINTYCLKKEFLDHINGIILKAFYSKHGEEGSHYLQSRFLEHSYNTIINDHQFDDIGEICVYSNSDVKPSAAMVTLGELGEYVCVKLVNEEKMYELMVTLIGTTSSFHPDNGGNIKGLI